MGTNADVSGCGRTRDEVWMWPCPGCGAEPSTVLILPLRSSSPGTRTCLKRDFLSQPLAVSAQVFAVDREGLLRILGATF